MAYTVKARLECRSPIVANQYSNWWVSQAMAVSLYKFLVNVCGATRIAENYGRVNGVGAGSAIDYATLDGNPATMNFGSHGFYVVKIPWVGGFWFLRVGYQGRADNGEWGGNWNRRIDSTDVGMKMAPCRVGGDGDFNTNALILQVALGTTLPGAAGADADPWLGDRNLDGNDGTANPVWGVPGGTCCVLPMGNEYDFSGPVDSMFALTTMPSRDMTGSFSRWHFWYSNLGELVIGVSKNDMDHPGYYDLFVVSPYTVLAGARTIQRPLLTLDTEQGTEDWGSNKDVVSNGFGWTSDAILDWNWRITRGGAVYADGEVGGFQPGVDGTISWGLDGQNYNFPIDPMTLERLRLDSKVRIARYAQGNLSSMPSGPVGFLDSAMMRFAFGFPSLALSPTGDRIHLGWNTSTRTFKPMLPWDISVVPGSGLTPDGTDLTLSPT